MNHWIDVELSWEELHAAAQIGMTRQLSGIYRKRNKTHGKEADGWSNEIEGAVAEHIVARYFEAYWPMAVDDISEVTVDLPHEGIQVRQTSRHNNRLLVRPKDNPNLFYVSVSGEFGKYKLRGWASGTEVKQKEFEHEGDGRGNIIYLFPNEHLRDIRTLKQLLTRGLEV